jgi:hypothetical protein
MNDKGCRITISIKFADSPEWTVPIKSLAQTEARAAIFSNDAPNAGVRIYCRSARSLTTIVVWGSENPHRLVLRRALPRSASGARSQR